MSGSATSRRYTGLAPDANLVYVNSNGSISGDTPWETIVGGTSLAIGSRGQYLWETPWAQTSSTLNEKGTAWQPALPGTSDLYYVGGGGVTRALQPWYQQGVATDNVVDGQARRVGPGVAMEADCFVGGYPEGSYQPTSPTGAGDTWYTRPFCGTSMASPMFTALEANLVQKRHGLGARVRQPDVLRPVRQHRIPSGHRHPAGCRRLGRRRRRQLADDHRPVRGAERLVQAVPAGHAVLRLRIQPGHRPGLAGSGDVQAARAKVVAGRWASVGG